MRKGIGKWLILLLAVLAGTAANAQCTVKAFSDPIKNYCGNPFFPYAIGDAGKYVVTYANNFNSKSLGSGWTNSTAITFDNICGPGDGTPYVWMVGGTDRNRTISTVDFNVATGGKVCFDLRFAEINGTNQAPDSCEAPDQTYEGVYFQYSTDAGQTWQDIFYFNPSPFPNAQYTQWNKYCYPIPEEALSANTRFRWHQAEASGPDVDHWGIDNVEILTNDPNYEYIWDHTTVRSAKPGYHVPPTSPYTYHVTYKHKTTGEQCDASVTVTTIPPELILTPGPINACKGTPVQLNAEYKYSTNINTCAIQQNGCMGTPGTKTIGTSSDTSYVVFNNATKGSNKSQFIIRANELNLPSGQISSIGLIAFDNGVANKSYYNLSIRIACTDDEEYTGGGFIGGGTTVFTRGSFNFKNGLNVLDLDEYYDYNGKDNLVIEICWANILMKGNLPLKGNKMGWNSGNYISGNTNNTSTCGKSSGGTMINFRPTFQIGYCTPVVSNNLKYTWTPAAGLSSATIKDPKATPTQSTLYTVEIVDVDHPQCKVSGQVQINVLNVVPGQDTTRTLCKNSGLIDLFTLLKGTPQTGGTWKNPAGTGFNGSINPATAQPGVYTYTVSDPNCGTQISRITLNFQEPPNAGTPKDTTFCNTKNNINLFPLLKGSPDVNGTWVDNNGTGALNSGVFDATKVTPGTYRFTYKVPATTYCPAAQSSLNITIVAPPNAGTNTSASACNSAGTINLFNLLNGNPESGGTWTNNNNAGTINGNILDITGVANGTYTYTYTVPPSAWCLGTKAVLTLTVVEQPDAGKNGGLIVCQTTPSVNLFSVLTGTPDPGGKWTDIKATGQMTSAGIFTITGLNPGTYPFTYTMEVAGCPKSEATVTVTVVKQNYAGTGKDTLICSSSNFNLFALLSGYTLGGTWTDESGTGRLNGSSFNANGIASGAYVFKYTIASSSPCVSKNVTVTVNTERPAEAGTGKTLKLCKGETRDLAAELSGSTASSGFWSSSPVLPGLNSSTGSLNTTTANPGTYLVRFVITGKPPCSNDTAEFTIIINEKPQASNVQYFCINQNRQYYVEFEVNKGQSSSYTFVPTGTKLPGTPYRFRSNAITSKTKQTFYINDANNCGPDSIVVFYDCGCVTQAGSMSPDTIRACENDIAKATFDNGFVNDGNDTSLFVLHEGNAAKIVNAKAYSKKPEFTYQTGMVYGKVYYISAVAADKGGPNGFSLNDTCLDVSIGTPVIFNPIPAFSFTENSPLCQGDSLRVNLSFTKGTPPFTVNYTYQGSNGSKVVNSANGILAMVAKYTDDFFISSISAHGCTATFTQKKKIVVDDSLVISNFTYSCNNDNNGYVINFDISKGDQSKYKVTGLAGTLAGGHFTSVELPSPSPYNFSVSDGSHCPPKSFNGTYVCPCVTKAGTMTNTNLIKVCGTDSARAPFKKDQVLDGNDRQYFILHTVSGSPKVIKRISSTPAFAYDPSLVYGTRYYISSVAGDSITGFIDTTERCFSISASVPVEFYPAPSGVLSGDTTVCEGQPLDLKPGLTGYGPYSLTFVDNTGRNYNFPNVNAGDPMVVKPAPGNYVFRFSKMRDLSSGCNGDTSGYYKVVIVPSPKATLEGDTSYCDGTTAAKIRLKLSGEEPFSGTVSLNGSTVESFTGAGKYYEFISAPPVGTNVYKLSSLYDQSAAGCPGFSDDSVTVTVFPIATISISGNDSVCLGESTWIYFTANGVPVGYQGQYQITYNHLPSNTVNTFQMKGAYDSLRVTPENGTNSYYISAAKDTYSGCTDLYSGSAIVEGVARPGALITGDSTFCYSSADTARLYFNLKGHGLITVYFSDDKGNHFTTQGNAQTAPYIVNLPVNQGMTVFSIDSVKDGTGLHCSGLYSGSVEIMVNALPDVDLSVNRGNVGEICEGDQAYLQIEATGKLPIIVEIGDETGTVFKDTLFSPNHTIAITPPSGTHVYRVKQVQDSNTPNCFSTPTDSVSIVVHPKPVVSMTLVSDSICSGEAAILNFTVNQGTLPIELRLSVDGQPLSAPVIMNSGTTSEQLFLSSGVHTIRVISIRDLSGAKCEGDPTGIPAIQILVRETPVIVSLKADPNPVCYNDIANIQFTANGVGPYSITLQTIDSSWTETFITDGSSLLGPMRDPRKVSISKLEYINSPRCTDFPVENVVISVNALPTAQITTPDTAVCEGEQFPVTIATSGFGTISGTITNGIDTFAFSTNTGVTQTMVTANGTGYYYFPPNTVEDSRGCRNTGTDSLFVTIHPIPVIDFAAYPPQSCVPLVTRLVNLTDPVYIGGGCNWNIGPGIYAFNSCDSTPKLTFDKSGNFDVSLTIVSPYGCKNTLNKPEYLQVHPNPEADFEYNPNPVYISNTIVQFLDRSTHSASWYWDFEEFGVRNLKNPVIEFPAEPEMEITAHLTVTSEFGCVDSTSKKFKIVGELLVNVPNTFTPNNDGKNEVFIPVIYGLNESAQYEFQIFDRWGELIFETNDHTIGWNGLYKDGQVQVGVYAYRLKVQSKYSKEIREYMGHVNVVR